MRRCSLGGFPLGGSDGRAASLSPHSEVDALEPRTCLDGRIMMSYETHICNFSLGILTYMFASQFLHLLAMLRAGYGRAGIDGGGFPSSSEMGFSFLSSIILFSCNTCRKDLSCMLNVEASIAAIRLPMVTIRSASSSSPLNRYDRRLIHQELQRVIHGFFAGFAHW